MLKYRRNIICTTTQPNLPRFVVVIRSKLIWAEVRFQRYGVRHNNMMIINIIFSSFKGTLFIQYRRLKVVSLGRTIATKIKL